MYFEDVLYPDNPARRDEIRRYIFELRNAVHQYVRAWNGYVSVFNQTSEPAKGHLLDKLVHQDSASVADLLKQIGANLETTEAAVEGIVRTRLKLRDGDTEATAAALAALLSKGTAGAYDSVLLLSLKRIGAYPVKVALRSAASVVSLNAILGNIGGAVGAHIVGDLMVSAITGAIQRREYRDTIDVFKRIHDNVTTPVRISAEGFEFLRMSIDSGILRLSPEVVMVRGRNGEYRRIEV